MADDMGLGALGNSIADLGARLSAALPSIVMQGAQIVEGEIRQRAPVDTGALATSLDVQEARRALSASATVQIERSGPDGAEHYAIFREMGTSHTPAEPFFRPGVEAARDRVGELLAAEILNVVQQP